MLSARPRLLAVVGAATLALTIAVVGAAMGSAGTRGHGQARPAVRPRSASPGGTTADVQPRGLRTSCRSVAHIGDSTSVDLISPSYLPDPAQRLGARYAAVGVKHVQVDASGGRSIDEALLGQVNGYGVAQRWRSEGYHGCWVFALGTNDAANIAAGSSIGPAARIDQMMAQAQGQPVMWVNTATELSSGYWANSNEQAWDRALVQALHRFPNMRIFDWAAVAQASWFLSDGVHYTSYGCAQRAKAIADALARAFPLHGRSAGPIVG